MWKRVVILSAAAIGAAAYIAAVAVIPSVAADALLHPARKPVHGHPPAHCLQATFDGAGVTLSGWRCAAHSTRVARSPLDRLGVTLSTLEGSGQAVAPPRATIVFLHGIADNRESVSGAIDRFVARGYDVVTYDSRAHGASTGDACTYGYWEKRDLRRVLDTIDGGPIVLLGTSLGAAVALQEAADDRRVGGIVAAEVFSDLNTVARERAPHLLPDWMIQRAFEIAEARGNFRVDDASPLAAARRITVPVLLIHGAADVDTKPDHSRRVAAALAGPKELLLVDGAHHNESLRSPDIWQRIDRWIDTLVTGVTP